MIHVVTSSRRWQGGRGLDHPAVRPANLTNGNHRGLGRDPPRDVPHSARPQAVNLDKRQPGSLPGQLRSRPGADRARLAGDEVAEAHGEWRLAGCARGAPACGRGLPALARPSSPTNPGPACTGPAPPARVRPRPPGPVRARSSPFEPVRAPTRLRSPVADDRPPAGPGQAASVAHLRRLTSGRAAVHTPPIPHPSAPRTLSRAVGVLSLHVQVAPFRCPVPISVHAIAVLDGAIPSAERR